MSTQVEGGGSYRPSEVAASIVSTLIVSGLSMPEVWGVLWASLLLCGDLLKLDDEQVERRFESFRKARRERAAQVVAKGG